MARCGRCGLFMFGVGLGIGAGMLLAPKAGRDIRQELFGGSMDVTGEPGTQSGLRQEEELGSEEELKARIEETSARLKAEIEARQEEDTGKEEKQESEEGEDEDGEEE